MHRYQPRIHVVAACDIYSVQFQQFNTYAFPECQFIAVTAYQNSQVLLLSFLTIQCAFEKKIFPTVKNLNTVFLSQNCVLVWLLALECTICNIYNLIWCCECDLGFYIYSSQHSYNHFQKTILRPFIYLNIFFGILMLNTWFIVIFPGDTIEDRAQSICKGISKTRERENVRIRFHFFVTLSLRLY